MEKFNDSDDNVFKTRAVQIKEERAELVKHHLWVLWTDYFKPKHLEAYPQLHELFWNATKAAGSRQEDAPTWRSPTISSPKSPRSTGSSGRLRSNR